MYIFQSGGAVSSPSNIVADKIYELFLDSDIYWSTNDTPLSVRLVDAGEHLSEAFTDRMKILQVLQIFRNILTSIFKLN